MPLIAAEAEIAQFFDGFVTAFGTFDGKIVGALFIAPGVALKQDGTLHGFATQRDIETYYQNALDHYRASGCLGCRYSDLDIRFLNERSIIATASWDLIGQDGSASMHWRQAYFLSRNRNTWRIFGSAFVSH